MATVALSGIITPTNVVTATSTTTLTNKTLTGAVMNGTLGATTPSTVVATTVKASTTMGVGGATPSASGSGISFPATQSSSTDANTLDDYEEGTWTPAPARYTGGAITTSGGSITATGTYTKIGNHVTITGRISLSGTLTQGSSDTIITGIPFNSSALSAMSIGPAGALTNYPLQASQEGLFSDSTVSGFSFSRSNAWVSGGNILFSGTYFV